MKSYLGSHWASPGRVVLLVMLLIGAFVIQACGGGGAEPDGDEEIDNKCEEGYIYSNGRCVPIPTDGDTDRDKDASDGDVPDGDIPDEDRPDGDLDDVPTDGDIEDLEPEDEPEWETPDQNPEVVDEYDESPVCVTSFDCLEGETCIDGRCVEDTPDGDTDPDWDWEHDGELEYCESGQISCASNDDCPPFILCNPEDNCCDESYYVTCQVHEQCPTGYHCNGIGICDSFCLWDTACPPTWCCTDIGYCVPFQFCNGGDEEVEEEIPTCSSCQDCLNLFGEGYFCNIDTATCQPGDCCDDSDCDQQAGGLCNLYTGTCFYPGDQSNIGSISGTITADDSYEGFVGLAEMQARNLFGDVLGRGEIGEISEIGGGVIEADYTIEGLFEGDYYVYIAPIDAPEVEPVPYFYNPVTIDYDTSESTHVVGIDFYAGVDNPQLAEISGTVFNTEDYWYRNFRVQLHREVSLNELEQVGTVNAIGEDGPSSLERAFSFINVEDGLYYLETRVTMPGGEEQDYWSSPTVIDLQNNPMQRVTGIEFYFSSSNDVLGSLSGTIRYADWYDAEDFSVELYRYPKTYAVARAAISSASKGELSYSFDNIEGGLYWIRAFAMVGDVVVETRPASSTINVIEGEENDYTGRNVFFDVVRSDLCSISGTLSFPDSMDANTFRVKVFQDAAYTQLLVADPVFDVDPELNEANYFVENLDSGTYYLKAESDDGVGGVSEVAASGSVTVDVSSGPKDVGDVDLDFNP